MSVPTIPCSVLIGLLGNDKTVALLAAGSLPLDIPEVNHLTFWRLLRDNIERTGDEHHALGAKVVPEGSIELLLAAVRLVTEQFSQPPMSAYRGTGQRAPKAAIGRELPRGGKCTHCCSLASQLFPLGDVTPSFSLCKIRAGLIDRA